MKNRTRFAPILGTLCGLGTLVAFQATAGNWASPGGKGSYALVKPADGVKPDGGPVRMTLPAVGPNVDPAAGNRKVPTSDWWTPLAWLDPADLPGAGAVPAMTPLCWQIFSDILVGN